MARPKQTIINGEKWCAYHGRLEPIDGFRSVQSGHGTVSIFKPSCRLAEQTIRDHAKAANPAHTAIVGRAKKYAGDASKALGVTISYHWVLYELHWIGLVPYLNAAIGPGGTCLNCGNHWDDPEQYHLAHKLPYPTITSWAYHHARNLEPRCPKCNCSQGHNDSDHGQLLSDHHKWMVTRDWATLAGTPGWPPYEPAFGTIPELIVIDGPCDQHGIATLF